MLCEDPIFVQILII